jgi:hypothetical protein
MGIVALVAVIWVARVLWLKEGRSGQHQGVVSPRS